MTRLHQLNGGVLGARLEIPSSEPQIDFFASFKGSAEPSYPNWDYGEESWRYESRDSDGYALMSGLRNRYIFSQPLTKTGTWTLEYYLKSNTSSAPEWTCNWTGLDIRHRHLEIAHFNSYGDAGTYDNFGNGHRRSGVNIFDQTWHHIMWSCNSGSVTFYVDGTAEIGPFSINGWTSPLYGIHIGEWMVSPGSYSSLCYVKNMRVTYGQALTAASDLPSYSGGTIPSGVYKVGSANSLITTLNTGAGASAASPIYKVGRLDATNPQNWFTAGYFGVDKSAFFENGKTYTTFKVRAPEPNARTFYPCIAGKNGNSFYPVAGFTCTIPAGTTARTVEFDLTDPNLPGKFGSFTVPFGGRYFMAWHSGSSGSPLYAEFNSSQREACVDYIQTNSTPTIAIRYDMGTSNTACAMQMEWS